ncbi:MAG: hypothetical protein ABEN55_19355, partial [Bradymonadaceae bacterium]
GWVFGLSELYEANLWPLPDPDAVDDAWIDRAASALADVPGLRPRLASMCRHMVLWSTYREGANTAGLFATLADGIEGDFVHSPLVRVMAERTPTFYAGRPDFGELAPYHQMAPLEQRRQLAERFFGAPEPADQRQDRQLDFIELAFSVLQFVRPAVPSEHQPRWEEMIQLAGRLGTEVAEIELDDVPVDRPGLREFVEQVLADADWPDTRPEIVYPELTTNFAAALRLDLPVHP